MISIAATFAVQDAVADQMLTDPEFFTEELRAEIAAGIPAVFVRSVDQLEVRTAYILAVYTLGVVTETGRQLHLRELGSQLIRFQTTERMMAENQSHADSLFGEGTPVYIAA